MAEQQPQAGGAAPAPTGQTAGAATGGGQQDALDKGIDQALNRVGHGQSRGTTEKISDGIRSIFKKATGKDVPVQDKQ